MSSRSVTVNALDDIRVDRSFTPRAAAGQVLVHSRIIGICGSDMHAARGHHPFMSLPFQPGHEVVGVVAGLGEGVDPALQGQRVVIEPNLTCGHCEQCLAGSYNICAELEVFGCQTPGGMADAFVIDADRIIPLPDDIDDLWAALIEPLATPVHAVRRAGDLTGKKVLVIGAGPIGLFTALAARAAGAERVVVADIIASKRERALRLGADAAFDSSTEDAGSEALEAIGGAAHVVFDCVSHVTTVRLAIEVLSKGGRLQVVGVPAGETLVALDLIQDRELTVAGNLMYVREDMVRALEILRPKPFDIDELVTATFDLAQAADAFHAAADPDQVKVLVTVSA